MMKSMFDIPRWQGFQGGDTVQAPTLEHGFGGGYGRRGMFGQQTGGGYDSSGINPHGQFGGQPQGQIPQAGYEQGRPLQFPQPSFPQRPQGFNPMPMGQFGQSPFGQPQQSGGYDSSGINPGGMYSQPQFGGMLGMFGSGYAR